MKIAPRDLGRFLKAPASMAKAVLIYGPDSGLISERGKQIGLALVPDLSDPFNVVDMAEERIRTDPPVLSDELNAMSFTGGQRLVIVRDASDKISETVASCLESGFNAFLLLLAGELTPRSSLRSLFEKHASGAALACYNDDASVLQDVITQTLGKAGIRYDHDVVTYLCQQLGNDRRVTLSELEKLITFAGDSLQLSLEDVMTLVSDNHDATMDECCIALANRNYAEADKALSRMLGEGIQAVTILRAVQRYFQRLHMLKGLCMQGMSAEQAIGQLRPPVFFKMQPILKRHVERWQLPQIIAALNWALQAEKMAKSGLLPQDSICRYLTSKIIGEQKSLAG